jgi:hypothetical protein
MKMSARQQLFRAEFRNKIAPAYAGLAHVALIYALGAAAIYYAVGQVHAPAWYEYLVIPAAFCISNVFEWWIHKYVMHRPVKGLMGIYSRHTLAHHQFFTNVEPTIDNLRDFRIVFFPPYALVAFMLLSIPPALILGVVGLANAGWLLPPIICISPTEDSRLPCLTNWLTGQPSSVPSMFFASTTSPRSPTPGR